LCGELPEEKNLGWLDVKTKTKNKNGTHWVPFLLIIHGERPVV
jgi:hypothetical protein